MYDIHISFWLSIAVAIAVMAWLLGGSSFDEKRRRNLARFERWLGWAVLCGLVAAMLGGLVFGMWRWLA